VLATDLTHDLKAAACAQGFSLVGVCPAVTPQGINRLYDWIDAGRPGEMNYFANRREAYRDPSSVLPGVRSIIMLAMNYGRGDEPACAPGEGRVARYARGQDYHEVLWSKLDRLTALLKQLAPESNSRGVVDTAPLLERDFAQLAGLGWIGKNTLLLNKTQGSWFVLGALLTDLELSYDQSHESDHCGTCTACLDACPTQAFTGPYQLDPRRCISYLTIEHRSPISPELRPGIRDWAFGCDVCQEVCPWNHKAPVASEPAFAERSDLSPLDLLALFDLSEGEFRARFRGSPLWRPKRRGLLRNAAIVLGNQRDERALPALIRAVNDAEPLVRGAAAWALGQFSSESAATALHQRLSVESDEAVRVELLAAVGRAISQ
jgi:epoxyqueuosine reductase